MKTLEDDDIMPFGKHRGSVLSEVDGSYLIWLWNNGMKGDTKKDDNNGALARYIKNSLYNLSREYPDKIIDKED